jgi:ATP-dependent RNA helicase
MAAHSRKRRAEADETEDLKDVKFESSPNVKVMSSFEKMGLRQDLLRGIHAYGE